MQAALALCFRAFSFPYMQKKIKIGISSCLLGRNVRYDGGHKFDAFLIEALSPLVEWVPVCPEVECGLPVPREAMRLTGDGKSLQLVTIETKVDHTESIMLWTNEKLKVLEQEQVCGFIFKARSPSCGIDDTELFSESGRKIGTCPGIFSRAVRDCFPSLPVEDEEALQEPNIRESFLKCALLCQSKFGN
ncbi:MAG: DUF523 domain-containing protein [Nitrospirota bacterium]